MSILIDELRDSIEQAITNDNESSQDYRGYVLEMLIRKLVRTYETTVSETRIFKVDSPMLGEITLDFELGKIVVNPFQAGKRVYVTPTTTHELTLHIKKGSI